MESNILNGVKNPNLSRKPSFPKTTSSPRPSPQRRGSNPHLGSLSNHPSLWERAGVSASAGTQLNP